MLKVCMEIEVRLLWCAYCQNNSVYGPWKVPLMAWCNHGASLWPLKVIPGLITGSTNNKQSGAGGMKRLLQWGDWVNRTNPWIRVATDSSDFLPKPKHSVTHEIHWMFPDGINPLAETILTNIYVYTCYFYKIKMSNQNSFKISYNKKI